MYSNRFRKQTVMVLSQDKDYTQYISDIPMYTYDTERKQVDEPLYEFLIPTETFNKIYKPKK